MKTDEILNERGKTHGSFEINAAVAQSIKYQVRRYEKYLSMMQIEALDQIALKIGRICGGEQAAKELDNWRDIAGYATLIVKELEKK